MALNNHDPGQIREYLLGKLDDQEQQEIEERLMVEDELFDEFEVSKDEVIQEYFSGDLSQNERQWLEHHYLASQEGRERHAFLLAMECLERPAPAPAPVPVQPADPRPTFFESIRSFFITRFWPVAAAASLAVVAIVAMLTSRPAGQIVIGPTLASNSIDRSAGAQPAKIKLPPNTDKLKLRLLLPKTATTATRYRADLDNRINTSPVEVSEFNAEAVTVTIPADKVPRGEYLLKLIATNADGTEKAIPGYYFFNIE